MKKYFYKMIRLFHTKLKKSIAIVFFLAIVCKLFFYTKFEDAYFKVLLSIPYQKGFGIKEKRVLNKNEFFEKIL